MTETLLGHLASGGGFALSWLWQATLIGTVAVICAAWLGPRRPLLAQGFLLAAFFRFALPPVSILSWAEQLPPLLSGPRQQGLELLVASEAGIRVLSWPAGLLALYWLGVLLGATRLAWQSLGLSRRVSDCERLEAPWLGEIGAMSKRLGVRRVPEVRISDQATVPFVVGLLRPIVVLPRRVVNGLRPQELERVTAHELSHLRRGDLWWNAMLAVLGVIWFFHPLYHLASSMWRRLAEEQSDAMVIDALKISPKSYARVLVATATVCAGGKASTLALAFPPRRRSHLELRIERLAGAFGARAAGPYQLLAGALLAFATVAALSVGVQPGVEGRQRIVFAHDQAGAELSRNLGGQTTTLGARGHGRHGH